MHEQVSLLLGRPAPLRLAAAIGERSSGNAYFTELLTRALPPDAQELPGNLPDALREALLGRWHGMEPQARDLTRLLAVAGRPVDYDLLCAGAPAAGVAADAVDACVRAAADAGVVQVRADQSLWFRHPLIAEVLADSTLPGERRRLHAAFVSALQADPSEEAGRLSDVSLHCEGAGLVDEAFETALRAADGAAAVQAPSEEATLRRRAARLHPSVSAEVRGRHPSHPALLLAAAEAAHRAGRVGRF